MRNNLLCACRQPVITESGDEALSLRNNNKATEVNSEHTGGDSEDGHDGEAHFGCGLGGREGS